VSPEAGELDRVLKALNHPVRRRILWELGDRDGSATTLSRSFKLDLGIVSYHLNKVLAKQCKVVELVDTVPRRGSVEKFYRLGFEGPLDLPAGGEPGSWEEASWAMSLGESLLKAALRRKDSP
jgi:DNA-binding transcriptional ArsR family regulator